MSGVSRRRSAGSRMGKDVHERALGLLAVRQRSRRELQRRLEQAGFEVSDVAEELGRLERVGLLDDDAFARAVAEQGFGSRGQGRRAVASKLAAAGIASDRAGAVLDELQGEEAARAREVARAKAARMTGVAPQKAFTRLYGLLARRGFAPGVAREAAREALAVEGFED
jgi:regulatory protein